MRLPIYITVLVGILAVATFPAIPASASDQLVKAYQKEFAFLEAEKASLKKRLAEVEADSKAKVGRAQAEIEALQQQVLGLRGRADQIEMEMDDVEDQTASAKERSDLLEETIERASETLSRHGFDPPKKPGKDVAEQAEQIETLFAMAGQAVEKASAISKETGTFFRLDGAQESGTIVRIGKVAAFGANDTVAGALAPAGAGRFKIWHEEAGRSARDVIAGKPVSTLAMFLFESLDKGVEEKQEKTVLSVIQSGGIIAWVIVCLGGLALLMIVARVFILILASSRTDRLLQKLRKVMGEGTKEDALLVVSGAKGAAARVLKATIRNLDRDRAHLEDIVSEAILHEVPFIERFGATILVVAAVAPLLGLLGTVTGMISTFDMITEYGTGDPKLLSGGISEALVTTELGLVVAIPSLLIGTLLSGRANAILQTLERAALQVMNLAEQPGIRERMAASPSSGGEPPSREETPNADKTGGKQAKATASRKLDPAPEAAT